MLSSDDFGTLKELLSQLCLGNADSAKDKRDCKGKQDTKANQSRVSLTPSQILIMTAFLAGVLEVNSVLVDKNQDVEIVLTGSLKREIQSDQSMKKMGRSSF